MLRWLDRYPCQVEVKGYSMPLSAINFWITSNINPRNWYPNAKQFQIDGLMRRITATEFVFPWLPPAEGDSQQLLSDILTSNLTYGLGRKRPLEVADAPLISDEEIEALFSNDLTT